MVLNEKITMNDSSNLNITAFNGIFEARLQKLVIKIKELRKDKCNKDRIKECIKEAKHLKKAIKKVEKPKLPIYEMFIDREQPDLIICSENIEIDSIGESEGMIHIRFSPKV